MFLYVLAYHFKNRVIKHQFGRLGETVSRYFHNVLKAILRLQAHLYKKPQPIAANSEDRRALDRTYIKIRVPGVDRPRYRTRKGDIATNVLGVCTPYMQFAYVLSGWEGSAADGRVLRDALFGEHGLRVFFALLLNIGCYYLVDAGYTNCEGFLAPFRGQKYHLNERRQ
ncbi:hypothetical protein CRG98_025501 [Punica granatum]|uniref:Uncharacterized protein n=1 Tax=Punica granatum TaxID=22663 RepID=A0A2I0JEL0_PUNGR|nr:hypothetical protein CRG98_025501 [Punica granatum]